MDDNTTSADISIPPITAPAIGKKAIAFPISAGLNSPFTGMGRTVRNPKEIDNGFIILYLSPFQVMADSISRMIDPVKSINMDETIIILFAPVMCPSEKLCLDSPMNGREDGTP